MKIWRKVEPHGAIKALNDPGYDYSCSLPVRAWENQEEQSESGSDLVALVIGLVKSGVGEIRVQYEKADYEANKSNLLVRRAVKEAMGRVQEHVTPYLHL